MYESGGEGGPLGTWFSSPARLRRPPCPVYRGWAHSLRQRSAGPRVLGPLDCRLRLLGDCFVFCLGFRGGVRGWWSWRGFKEHGGWSGPWTSVHGENRKWKPRTDVCEGSQMGSPGRREGRRKWGTLKNVKGKSLPLGEAKTSPLRGR